MRAVRLARLGPAAALVGLALAACGGATANAPTATATPSPSAVATVATSAGAWTVTSASKATVRVREQLVGVSLPSDAVLTATGATGTFQLNADGTFTPDSMITIDLTTLASDQRDRDNFIKQTTLGTRQFPKAEFVPMQATGLSLPLPSSGTFTFTLTGKMTVRGTTKEVTFDVTAQRDGANLTATATANPTLKFEDFGLRAPSVPFRVVSVTDEIKLVVDLVATGPVA